MSMKPLYLPGCRRCAMQEQLVVVQKLGLVHKDAIRMFLSEVHQHWAKQADKKQAKKVAKP